MVLLARTVRFSINPDGTAEGHNGYAGVPAMRGLGRHYEVTVQCEGKVDDRTGYFVNIKQIDAAVRQTLIPIIARACTERSTAEPSQVLFEAMKPLDKALGGRVRSVRWNLSPYYCVEMNKTAHDKVLLRQRFEFAASHRLHVQQMSDEQNRQTFGRCNNPSGHGHNYVVEPCVAVAVSPTIPFGLSELERVVLREVVEHFDHTHLNIDVSEFQTGSGLNPSVENIARVCYQRLAPAIAAASQGAAELREVTVWETEKTSCTYPA